MRLDDWIAQTSLRFRELGIESPSLEAQVLAAHGLCKDRGWVLAHGEVEVVTKQLNVLASRREAREPLAYILGYREFFGREFFVDRRVLIPRQETETVIETALALIPKGQPALVLDLATGSGAIGVTLALERPEWEVWASDISGEALEVARSNADRHRAAVAFVESDLFAVVPIPHFDLVVSNPPYIATSADLMPEVGEWEPRAALFAEEDGLEFYRRLAREAADRGAVLVTEVGDGQSGAVADIFKDRGWKIDQSAKDLIGHDRALVLRAPKSGTPA